MAAKRDPFEEIAQRACREAAEVDVSIPEYISGLKYIISELELALDAAQDDLRREEEAGD